MPQSPYLTSVKESYHARKNSLEKKYKEILATMTNSQIVDFLREIIEENISIDKNFKEIMKSEEEERFWQELMDKQNEEMQRQTAGVHEKTNDQSQLENNYWNEQLKDALNELYQLQQQLYELDSQLTDILFQKGKLVEERDKLQEQQKTLQTENDEINNKLKSTLLPDRTRLISRIEEIKKEDLTISTALKEINNAINVMEDKALEFAKKGEKMLDEAKNFVENAAINIKKDITKGLEDMADQFTSIFKRFP